MVDFILQRTFIHPGVQTMKKTVNESESKVSLTQ